MEIPAPPAAGDLTLRPIGMFDAALLSEIHGRCFTENWDLPWSPQSFTDVLAMPGASGLLAAWQNEPIGFGLTLAAADEVELLLLAVLPAHRGKGWAGTLLAALLHNAALAGARRALLEVAAGNARAIASYRRAGFSPCGRRKAYYAGQMDALVFEKPLDPPSINVKVDT